MLRTRMFSLRAAWILAATFAAPVGAAETNYPTKPVSIVVPFAVGGAIDTLARPLSEAFQASVGQALVVENLGGAGGSIAAARIARAKPDGYQLLVGSNGPISIAPLIYPELQYDPGSLIPIVHIADSSNVLYASADSGFKTLDDVLKKAGANPRGIDFAHAGIGSLGHLSVELLASEAKVKFTGVPYKGSGAALADLASGQVPLLFTNYSTAQPLVEAGRVRPIAVASEQRLKLLPDVPTFAEVGYPKVVAKLWVGLMAPKGTPQPAVDRMSREIGTILAQPAMRTRLEDYGWEVQGGDQAAFREVIEQDTRRWHDLSKLVNLAPK